MNKVMDCCKEYWRMCIGYMQILPYFIRDLKWIWVSVRDPGTNPSQIQRDE